MTEDLLSKQPARPEPGGDGQRGRRFRYAVALSLLPLIMAGMWLGRVPIAETAARSFCRDRDLDCEIDISRLDFGGATLRNLRITGVSGEPAVSADRLAVDLDWSGPFAATAGWIGGDNVLSTLPVRGPSWATWMRRSRAS